MTPKPESETDPWKAIQRYELVQTNFAYTTDHDMERDAEGEWARWEAVDAARAAEAAQHQQEKDTLRTMATRLTCWRCGTAAYQPNERCDSHMSWTDRLQTEVEHHNAWRKRADEAEAERDRLKAALQGLQSDIEHDAHVNQPEAFRNYWRGRLHSEIAALTPQGQSTDGETR